MKVVKVVKTSQCYNTIVGGVHSKYFVCLDGTTKVNLHERLEVMRSDENKIDCAYEVKISVFSIHRLQVGKYP